MEAVTLMQNVHIPTTAMMSNVNGVFLDSCYENNGGCGENAVCSHESGTFAVVCKCQVGYINSGSDSTLSCIDSCKRDNGGCQPGAVCSHDPVTFAVVCGCPDGFVNSGCGADSKCV
ncbi:unnamed protein product, partial [Rotaria sp. Silwood1]